MLLLDDQKQDNESQGDRFSNFMFGGTRREEEERIEEQEFHSNQSFINFEELMGSIDSLVESVQNLKPLFQKIFPFVEKIWKK